MPPQGPGMVGALPRPAWGALVGMLSPEGRPGFGTAWRATVLSLRRTCRALVELVGAGCVGGAGWLDMVTMAEAAQLEAAPTAGLGRALVVIAELPIRSRKPEELEALAEALAVAVERGHMIEFVTSFDKRAPAVTRAIEAALVEASREGLLLHANLERGESLGWSVDAMAQLSVVKLLEPERETVATLVGAGALRRITLRNAQWTDIEILSSLREVKLFFCDIEDISPLADVPLLVVSQLDSIEALPAMHNDVLKVTLCTSLTDVSGLAGGRVGHLELQYVSGVKDVSAIGAMQPPPRTVILEGMPKVHDVSMLAGVRRLEVTRCRKLNKATALAALEGKVGTIRWEE